MMEADKKLYKVEYAVDGYADLPFCVFVVTETLVRAVNLANEFISEKSKTKVVSVTALNEKVIVG